MLLLLFGGQAASIEDLAYRGNFNADLQVREHYLSLLYHKIPGEADWTLIDQGRVSSPEQTVEEKSFNRIDGVNRMFPIGVPQTTVTLAVYLDNDIEELARLLGWVRPPGGWAGTEEIKLDSSLVADFKIVNFDGATRMANVLFTEYINSVHLTRLSPPLDADGDARVVEISGSAESYYIIPRPGV